MAAELTAHNGELAVATTAAGTSATVSSSAAGSRRAGRRPVLGLGIALTSAAAFATSGAFAKPLLLAGWAPGAVVTLRITIAAAVLLVPTLVSLRGRWGVLRRNAGLVIGYGLTGVAGCQLAY